MEVAHPRIFDRVRRIGVVKHDLGSAGKLREFAERGVDRVLGQIGRDSEPRHEGPPGSIEAGRAASRALSSAARPP